MKREILFRGKRADNGEWIYGYLIGNNVIVGEVVDFEEDYFTTEFWYKVNPEIVNQFTGITDKNGIKVFEADVVKHKFRRVWSEQEHTSIVVWNDNFMCYYLFDGASYIRMREDVIYEVIGNAYDNPELVNKESNG